MFVGRAAELQLLHDRFAAARGGHGALVLVSGEAGIGKTRLTDEFATGIGARALVVRGEPGRSPAGAPGPTAWSPWNAVLRAWPSSAPQLPTGAAALALTPAARFALVDQTTRFLTAAASAQVLVVVLDDLHLADVASLVLLKFVARIVHELPLLVLGLLQADPPDHERTTLLADARRSAKVVELAPLALAELAAVVAHVQGRPAPASFVARLHHASGGNPMFALEVLAHDRNGTAVPPRVAAVVKAAVAGLAPAARRALGIAAQLGEEFDDALLRDHVGADVAALAVEAACGLQLMHPVGGAADRHGFRSPLVRQALALDGTGVHRWVTPAG